MKSPHIASVVGWRKPVDRAGDFGRIGFYFTVRTGEIGADRRKTHQRIRTQAQDAAAHFDGSYMEHITASDEAAKDRLMKGLDGFLERGRDREIFGLDPKASIPLRIK